ncbi:MAG: ABC transporter permease [Inconstantimicrobium porci]|uniref:ABC transporter permease n=1 Tax=Inconstantimicrobium porci TaxID=2652291 RepID=UPI002A91AA5B|nr:ABC transporter permease [Inconstantimicrobium porci]MDY5911459.1 ABC transporter permease [Inconstantimicrobium porci]
MKKIFNTFKLSKLQIYLVISFILSTCSFSILISSAFVDVKNTIEENKFNSNYSLIGIRIKNTEKTSYEKLNKIISTNITNNFTLGISIDVVDNQSEFGKENKIIAAGKDFDISKYDSIEGRYLTKSELDSNKKLAIVGNSFKNDLITKGKKKYIIINKEKYEVVGILSQSIFFSNSSIIPHKSLTSNKYSRDVYMYYIDNSSVHKLNSLDTKKYYIFKNNYIAKNPFVNTFKKRQTVQMSVLQFIAGFINLALFSIFYAVDMRKKTAIMRVIGAKKIHILKFLLSSVLKTATLGIIIGLFISSKVINYLNDAYPDWFISLDLFNIITSSLLCYIIAIIIVLVIMHKVLNFKILKEIR